MVTSGDDDSALPGKIVHFNGIDWYIIADDSTAADGGTVTLFAKEPIGESRFDESGSNVYAKSTVKSVLDAMTQSGGAFADVADAIVGADLGDVSVTGAKLWLLSQSEAYAVNENARKYSKGAGVGFWWLRTPNPAGDSVYGVVGSSGSINNNYPPSEAVLDVRPALKLDLSKVKFNNRRRHRDRSGRQIWHPFGHKHQQ